MVKKANKPTSEVEVNVDAIESKRLESLAFDQGVSDKSSLSFLNLFSDPCLIGHILIILLAGII